MVTAGFDPDLISQRLGFDVSRRLLLDRAAAEDLLVMTYHFPFPGVGRVSTDGDGWLWELAA